MYIKLKNDNETIIGFTYENISDGQGYDAQINDTILVDEKGRYKYKYIAGQLVELTLNEKKNHPVTIKNKSLKKIHKLKEKIKKLKELDDIKENANLTEDEKAIVLDQITEVTNEPIDEAD